MVLDLMDVHTDNMRIQVVLTSLINVRTYIDADTGGADVYNERAYRHKYADIGGAEVDNE